MLSVPVESVMIPGHADIYKILVNYGLVNQFVSSK